MLSPEIISRIKHIEIATRRLLKSTLVGDHRSAQKGTGLEFDQIREYQQGDDIRRIDWKSSARMNKILVKEYIEERSRTIIIAVDVSASMNYQLKHESKEAIATQVASVLALVGDYGNDYVGLVLFSDRIHHYVPPQRGRKHVHHLMQLLFSGEYHGSKTDFSVAFKHLISIKKKDAVLFFISDFIGAIDQKLLSIVSRIYDVIAISCSDKYEKDFPSVGLLEFEDLETGDRLLLDTKKMKNNLLQQNTQLDRTFKSCRVHQLMIDTQRPFMGDIILFLRQRMQY